MKITLTENQILLIIKCLGYGYDETYPKSDIINAKITRLTNKLKKAFNK